MNLLKCEICGSANLIKQEGLYTCQTCNAKHAVEEVRNALRGEKIQTEQNTATLKDFFDTEIPEDVRSKIKWKGKDNEEADSKPEKKSDDEVVKIPIVELFDESGEKIVFELLDTIEFEGNKYPVLTPYYETEEEYDLSEPANVFIMKEVFNNVTNESMLETVEDQYILQSVYDIFKGKHSNDFEFRDN